MNQIPRSVISFGEARVNILATSDNHGKISRVSPFYQNIYENRDNIFIDRDKTSTLNMFAVVGDWFMNPRLSGFLSAPKKTAGDFQVVFLNKLIMSLKHLVKDKNQNARFETVYTPGNHCFDAGDKYLIDHLKQAKLTTVVTNADLDNSPLIKNLKQKEKEKFVNSKEFSIKDSKNPNLIHKVLVLGVTTPGVDFYNPNLVSDIDIYDRSNKNDLATRKEDIPKTLNVLNEQIQEFKKKNPEGVVILLNHGGNVISNIIAENVDQINLILNAHDHKDMETVVNGTHIVSLSQDFEKLSAINLYFDDDGKFRMDKSLNKDNKLATNFYTDFSKKPEINPFKCLEAAVEEDNKPILRINDPENKINILSKKDVRHKNSVLANFITDSILASIRKDYPEVDVFGVASSAFRQDIHMNATNLELLNSLGGSIQDLSKIYIGDITGNELAAIIVENVEANNANPETNTIFQWSGIRFNRKLLTQNPENVEQAIQIKNKDGEYENLNPEKIYKVALPNKFFSKPNIQKAKILEDRFMPTELTMNDLFRSYLADNNYEVTLSDSTKETRIID